jgi:CheY-like chemotaxis protein
LVVDDDAAVRLSLVEILQDVGYELVSAQDGGEAVEQFAHYRPDVVLLDLNMPGRNGWQALDGIAQIDPLVPIIVITARPNQQGVASGRGVDALMEKPLDIQLLLDAIARLADQPKRDRCRRLTDPSFKTELLGSD